MLPGASASYTVRAPTSIWNVVNSVLGHFFCCRLPWVWGSPSGRTIFLITLVWQLDDFTLLCLTGLGVAKQVVKVISNLAICSV